MSKDGHSVAVLSGELTVEQRLAVLDRFRAGLEKVLITTNVLSRGIDVEQVTIVVNFDLPVDQLGNADCETYLHRIGRTGRFGEYFEHSWMRCHEYNCKLSSTESFSLLVYYRQKWYRNQFGWFRKVNGSVPYDREAFPKEDPFVGRWRFGWNWENRLINSWHSHACIALHSIMHICI